MYRTIIVPVDIEHPEKLEKALSVAADLAKYWKATITYVGVSGSAANEAGRTPDAYKDKLEELARREGDKHGQSAKAKVLNATDPARDLDHKLVEEIEAEGADLVVMASHAPALRDHIFGSNASRLLSHSEISIFIVR